MKKYISLLFLLFVLNCIASAQDVYPKPEVVTFYQKNCAACDQLNFVKKEMMEKYEGKVNFAKINIDIDDCDFAYLKDRYNIKTAPTTLFLNPQYGITKKTSGYIPKKLYEKQIEAIIAE